MTGYSFYDRLLLLLLPGTVPRDALYFSWAIVSPAAPGFARMGPLSGGGLLDGKDRE
jgi:hypothetical protein